MGTIFLIGASVVWGVVHSVLAAHGFKRGVRRLVGVDAFERLYRLAYNMFAIASFFPVLMMMVTFPDRVLYSLGSPWVYVMSILQGLAGVALIASVMQTGPLEFAGLAQLSPYRAEAQPARLVREGLYAWVRHPLYTASLVFIWCAPEMTFNRLIVWSFLTLYIFVGVFFEERKLQKDFGQEYAEYKAQTPMLLPSLQKILTRR